MNKLSLATLIVLLSFQVPSFAQQFSPELELKVRPMVQSFALQMAFRNIGQGKRPYFAQSLEDAEAQDHVRLELYRRLEQLPPNQDIADALNTYMMVYVLRLRQGGEDTKSGRLLVEEILDYWSTYGSGSRLAHELDERMRFVERSENQGPRHKEIVEKLRAVRDLVSSRPKPMGKGLLEAADDLPIPQRVVIAERGLSQMQDYLTKLGQGDCPWLLR